MRVSLNLAYSYRNNTDVAFETSQPCAHYWPNSYMYQRITDSTSGEKTKVGFTRRTWSEGTNFALFSVLFPATQSGESLKNMVYGRLTIWFDRLIFVAIYFNLWFTNCKPPRRQRSAPLFPGSLLFASIVEKRKGPGNKAYKSEERQ